MARRPLLYYITDRTAFAGDEAGRRRGLLDKIAEAARAGVDYIQLREKDLPARALETLAREAVSAIHESRIANSSFTSAALINSRTDIAMAVAADGVHLRSDDISPQEVREIWECAVLPTLRNHTVDFARDTLGVGQPGETSLPEPVIGVSCHSAQEVAHAEVNRASFTVFAPIFEKRDSNATPPAGLEKLRVACRAKIPVLALGGVNLSNAGSCLEAGAAGIAGIRLFQENDVAQVVRRLCE